MAAALRSPSVAVSVGLLLGLAGLSGATTAAARSVTLTGQFPAKFAEAGALRKLAVTRFQGRGGPVISDLLQADLTAVRINGAPQFTILSAPSQGGDPVTLGRAIHAEGVLSGEVRANVQDAGYTAISFGCVQRNSNGCDKFGLVPLQCVKRTVSVTVNVNLVRVADGRIVYSAPKSAAGNISWCAGQVAGKSDEMMLAEIGRPLAEAIRQDISPYSQEVKVKIEDSAKTLPKDLAGKFKAAVKLAPNDLSTSCAMWREVDVAAPNTPAVVFDLGVCAEATGDLAAASAFYQRAKPLLAANDNNPSEALSRVQNLQAAREEMARQEQRRQLAEIEERKRAAAAERSQQAAEAADRRRAAAKIVAAKAAQTAKRRQVAAKYGDGAADAIISGRVQKGMSEQQVLGAKGQPARRERISPGNEQWFYPGQRIIFTNGRVSYVGS